MAVEMIGSLNSYLGTTGKTATSSTQKSAFAEQLQKSKVTGKQTLDMDDFLKLMAAQLQNQDMNKPMSESEMMVQMAQMATVSAMTNMTDVAVTTYSASLVGKEVTLAYSDDANPNVNQLIGTVTGAGLYAGSQIIFVGGKSYSLSQIMAIGELPDADEKAIRVDTKGEILKQTKKQDAIEAAEETKAGETTEAKPVETKDEAAAHSAPAEVQNP